jgi:hypothetical protein
MINRLVIKALENMDKEYCTLSKKDYHKIEELSEKKIS